MLMNQLYKGLLLLFAMLMILFVMDLSIVEASESDYQYFDTGDDIEIIKYIGDEKEVVIPAMINGKPVVRIRECAFDNKQLTSVTIPNSVVEIGICAFRGNNLTEVTLPDSVKIVDEHAFTDNQLTTLVIGANVEHLNDNAFNSNPLKTIKVNEHNDFFNSVNDRGLYSKDGLKLIIGTKSGEIAEGTKEIGRNAFFERGLTEVTIPNSVEIIEFQSFAFNQLRKLIIPDNVETIQPWAFSRNQLTELEIPNSVKELGTFAFAYNLLKLVKIGASVGNFRGSVFANNPLEKVELAEGNSNYQLVEDGKALYSSDRKKLILGTTSGVILEGTIEIDISAFDGRMLEEISIPPSVQTIDNYAFRNNQLTRVNLPDSLLKINVGVFQENPNLVLSGTCDTTAQDYADAYKIPFVSNCNPLVVQFRPSGTDDKYVVEAKVEVFVYSYDELLTEQYYIWTNNETPPSFNKSTWTPFKNGEEIIKSDDGKWYLHVKAEDNAENVKNVHSNAFHLDNRSPSIELELTYGTDGTDYLQHMWVNENVNVSVTATDENMKELQIKINDEIVKTIAENTYSYTLSEDGIYSLTFIAIDEAGNETVEERTVKIDKTMPSAPIIQLYPEGWTNTDEVTVTITGATDDEDGSGVAKTEYRIGLDGVWAEYRQPLIVTEEGETTVFARTVDHAGNTSDISEAKVKIKRSIPKPPTISVPTTDWTNADKVSVTMMAEDEDVTIQYQLTDVKGTWITYTNSLEIVDEGITKIYARSIDLAGNVSEVAETTVKIDRTKPELTLLGNNPLNIRYGETFVEPGYEVKDNVTKNLQVVVSGEVDVLTLGVYEIVYKVQDEAGNEASIVRNVNVYDDEQPIITLLGDNPLIVEVGSQYEEQGAVAEDNADGDITEQVQITGSVDVTKLGTYEIRYNVTDSSGNKANEAVRIVEVIDTTPPELTLIGDEEITLELGEVYRELGVTASDNYDGDLTEEVEIHANINPNRIGTYEVSYAVKDQSNNLAKLTRKVHIVDTIAPTNVQLTISETTINSITLHYSGEDLGGIKQFILVRDGEEIAVFNGETSTFTDKTLEPFTTYHYQLVAVDYSENKSSTETVKVTTNKLNVTEVSSLFPILVAYGTKRSEIPFPEEVKVTLSNGEKLNVPVTWVDEKQTYDGNAVGKYSFIGEIALPEEIENSNRLKTMIDVIVETPERMELRLNESAIVVYAGAKITIHGSRTSLQLPNDLPEGTMLRIETIENIDTNSFNQVGEMYRFMFIFPEGFEDYEGEYILTMGVDEVVKNTAIYYYNETDGDWEYIGGEIRDGTITTTVAHFSIYGVLAKSEDEQLEKDITVDKQMENNGEKLPHTATNNFAYIYIGIFLITVGSFIWLMKRRKI